MNFDVFLNQNAILPIFTICFLTKTLFKILPIFTIFFHTAHTKITDWKATEWQTSNMKEGNTFHVIKIFPHLKDSRCERGVMSHYNFISLSLHTKLANKWSVFVANDIANALNNCENILFWWKKGKIVLLLPGLCQRERALAHTNFPHILKVEIPFILHMIYTAKVIYWLSLQLLLHSKLLSFNNIFL